MTFNPQARTFGIVAAWMTFIVSEVYAVVSAGIRVARGGRGERTLPLDYGSPGCCDGAVPGALDGRSSCLCITEQQTIQPRGSCFHDRLRGRDLLHQLLAAFGEQPAQSVFGVVARAVPSV